MALPLPLDQPIRLRPTVGDLNAVGRLFAHRSVRATAVVAVLVGTVVPWRAPGWSPLVVWTVAAGRVAGRLGAHMSTDPWSGDRHDPDRRYATATTITDVHTGRCPTCLAGGVCGRADQLMDDEYRTYETWRTDAPDAARAFDRAAWPTEG